MNKHNLTTLALVALLFVSALVILGRSDAFTIYKTAAVSDAFKGIFPKAPTFKLAMWLSFDEGRSAQYEDGSRHSNNGEAYGSPEPEIGVRGTALSFDSADDYIKVEPHTSHLLSSRFSFSAWVKLPAMGAAGGTVMSKEYENEFNWGAYALVVDPDGISLEVRGQEGSRADVLIPRDEWVHIAVVHSGGTSPDTLFYVNGFAVASLDMSSPAHVNHPLLIGRDGLGEKPFRGAIDEVRVYTFDLTPRAIAEIYVGDVEGE